MCISICYLGCCSRILCYCYFTFIVYGNLKVVTCYRCSFCFLADCIVANRNIINSNASTCRNFNYCFIRTYISVFIYIISIRIFYRYIEGLSCGKSITFYLLADSKTSSFLRIRFVFIVQESGIEIFVCPFRHSSCTACIAYHKIIWFFVYLESVIRSCFNQRIDLIICQLLNNNSSGSIQCYSFLYRFFFQFLCPAICAIPLAFIKCKCRTIKGYQLVIFVCPIFVQRY